MLPLSTYATSTADDGLDAARLVARLERLPFSRFHGRVFATVGAAHLFDAFDALALAFVLPSLIKEWGISVPQAGLLMSIGYVGQLTGAVGMSRIAEHIGRQRALRYCLFLLSGLSLACAFAPSYGVLLVLRLVQGLGLGGEVPIAASYLNEICPARFRGRVIFLLQALFSSGALITALIAVPIIPRFGWQSMFLIGTAPILLAIPLRRLIPESPRWLINRGRSAEAHATVAAIEAEILRRTPMLPPIGTPILLPPPARAAFGTLFANGYHRRTLSVWAMAFCISLTGYGIISWMPTLYTSVYHLPLAQALAYSLVPGLFGVFGALFGSLVIERLGRRRSFIMAFVGGGLPMLFLAGAGATAQLVVLISGISMFFMTMLLSGIYLYAPEIYPTSVRALGTGVATAWMRIASIVGPLLVGGLVVRVGIGAVFLLFGVAALLGALVAFLFLIETRGRSLEEVTA